MRRPTTLIKWLKGHETSRHWYTIETKYDQLAPLLAYIAHLEEAVACAEERAAVQTQIAADLMTSRP